jgi:hypothetical protein
MKIYSERELRERYNDLLNECYEPIRFGELSYTPAEVLESVDKIAWREGFNNWLDAEGIVDAPDNINGFVYQEEIDDDSEEESDDDSD